MLFLIAGASLVIHAAHHGLEALASVEHPLHHEFPLGITGITPGLIALLGLYPKTTDRFPKLARIGAVIAVLGAAGWIVMGISIGVEELGVEPPAWIGAVGLVMILSVILAYLIFSGAGRRTDIVSQCTGLALLTPVLVMFMNLGIVAAGLGSLVGQFAVASGFALAHLAIGSTLRIEDLFTEYGATTDPTT
jgi:hypothetical protein